MQISVNTILSLGLLASSAAAVPHNAALGKRSFVIERVANPNFTGRNGPKDLMKAYMKYGMPVPEGLKNTVAKQVVPAQPVSRSSRSGNNKAGNTTAGGTVNGYVAATPSTGDVEYVAPVMIGNQVINLDFDSGSSDLWVFSTGLPAASQVGHTVFDPTKSTTFKAMTGATFKISYGDGSGATGTVGMDTVMVGGATVEGQAVELATAVASSFVQDTASNGLLGLAYSKLNTVTPTQQKTFFDNIMPQLAEPVFTADLRKQAVGAYEFGHINQTKFTGTMAWTAVNTTQGFWQFPSSSYAVGTGAPTTRTTMQAIADTGTTLMIVSTSLAAGYYSKVQGAVNDPQVGGYTFPCNAQLPDLLVDVGGNYMARINGSDINFTPVTQTTCFGGVQATTGNLEIWGDVMFKSNFVAFNGGNNTLGFATHAFA